ANVLEELFSSVNYLEMQELGILLDKIRNPEEWNIIMTPTERTEVLLAIRQEHADHLKLVKLTWGTSGITQKMHDALYDLPARYEVLNFFMDKNSVNALHGQVTIRTLILQDCAVGLLFALLPVLGGTSGLLPLKVQVGVFSATMPPEALEITRKFMNKPVRILVKHDELTLEVGVAIFDPT
ncbi:hypothetical protein Tco_1397660, partial [Tanacetum coccineum]